MTGEHNSEDIPPGLDGGIEHRQAISLERAAEIAREVRRLISAGQEHRAREIIQSLHPADMGSIVVGLPRASRDAMLGIMSPETVAWMLRQMNPVEAGRIGARIGADMLSLLLHQVRPQLALATLRKLPSLRVRPQLVMQMLRRIPSLRHHDVPGSIEDALEEAEPLVHDPDTAGSLMVADFPLVSIEDDVEVAREGLRQLEEDRRKFTQILVLDQNDHLTGQISMVDLALAEANTDIRAITTPIIATVSPGPLSKLSDYVRLSAKGKCHPL